MSVVRWWSVFLGISLLVGCLRKPPTAVQQAVDSLSRKVDYCEEFYIIDESTLRRRIREGKRRLERIVPARLSAPDRARITQYRGILEVYRGFLEVYPAYEWDFRMLKKRADQLNAQWQSGALPADSVQAAARTLYRLLDDHCEQTRQWVRRVVDVEPLYERLAPQVARWAGDSTGLP